MRDSACQHAYVSNLEVTARNLPVLLVNSTGRESQGWLRVFTVTTVANQDGSMSCSRAVPTEEASNKAAVPGECVHNTLFSRPSLTSDARMREKTVAVATTLHQCSVSLAFDCHPLMLAQLT